MLFLLGSRLRKNQRWLLSRKPINQEVVAVPSVVEKDHLSRLPAELVVEILAKLDPKTLYHCTLATPRFLPYVSKIRSYSPASPSELIVDGFSRPLQIIAANVLCSPVLYFGVKVILFGSISGLCRWFYGLLPYSCLIFLACLSPVRDFIRSHSLYPLRLAFYLAIHPWTWSLITAIFRVIRYVVLHPVTRYTLGVVMNVVCEIIYRTYRLVYSPRVCSSGHRVFRGLKGLSSLEVTLPGKVFGDPALWVRGEKLRIADKTYHVYAEALVANPQSNQQQHDYGYDVWSLVWGVLAFSLSFIKEMARQVFQIIDIQLFVDDFPVSGEVVRAITRKNGGSNMRVRFDLKESTEKKSFLERVKTRGKKIASFIKEIILMKSENTLEFTDMHTGAMTLNEGSLVLKNVYVSFECCFHDVAKGTILPDVKDIMWAYLGDDEDEQWERDTGRKELKEVLKFILTSPPDDSQLLDDLNHYLN